MNLSSITKQQLRSSLVEDIRSGDKTSGLLIPKKTKLSAKIIAKESGIFCGTEVVRFLAKSLRVQCQFKIREGGKFEKGRTVLWLSGSDWNVLALERTLLNFIGHLSGISTKTSAFVKSTKKYKVKILDTRKTTPLWRSLEKNAVKVGGGFNHRMGLYDEVFVKENHKCYGNLEKLKRIPRKFVIEVCDHEELVEALYFKPRVILFDNYKPAFLKRAVDYVRKLDRKVILEASGGITLRNIKSYARTGVDQISIGSLTHSVKTIDFSMLVE